MLLQKVYCCHLPAVEVFISTLEKNYDHIKHSLHISIITANILITIIRFSHYIFYLFLIALSGLIFCTWVQFRPGENWMNAPITKLQLNSSFDNCTQILFDSSCWICFLFTSGKSAKTNLLGLLSNIFKSYFRTSTSCIFFLSSHVFTAFEFNSNHFGILILKIVKPREQNETKPSMRKMFQKYKPFRHYFEISQ